MIILNFSHPLLSTQIEELEILTKNKAEKIIDIPVQFDPIVSFEEQIVELADRIPLSAQELQALPVLVNLPALNYICAALLAELYGVMGYFPTIIRLRPIPNSLPLQYEAAEALNLQSVRDKARLRRVS